MPFRDDTPFEHLVEVFQGLLAAKRKATSPAAKAWGHRILNWSCRHLEDFIAPEVSVAAYQRAMADGCGDPRDIKWGAQKVKLKDPERKIYMYEHALTVSEMIRRLEALGENPADEKVLAIIKQMELVWILRSEDDALNKLGWKSRRPPNPMDAYVEAKIEIQPPRWPPAASVISETGAILNETDFDAFLDGMKSVEPTEKLSDLLALGKSIRDE